MLIVVTGARHLGAVSRAVSPPCCARGAVRVQTEMAEPAGGGLSNAAAHPPAAMPTGTPVCSSCGGVEAGITEGASPHAVKRLHSKMCGQGGSGVCAEGADTGEARVNAAQSPAHGGDAGDSCLATSHAGEAGGELRDAHVGDIPPLPPPPSAAPSSPLAWT